MPNQTERQLMLKKFQDSLRLVCQLMKFDTEKFAEAIGVTTQTLDELEAGQIQMTETQYIAVAALADSCVDENEIFLPKLKEILDGEPNFFREDSLLKRWFEDFIERRDDEIDDEIDDELVTLAHEYKIFLDATILTAADAAPFVNNLTAALLDAEEKIILPLRSIEQLKTEATQDEYNQAAKFIRQMQEANVLQIHGEETDPDFRATIAAVFERFRDTYNLCLITSDEQLARDVLRLKNSADDSEILVGFIDGDTLKFFDAENFSDEPRAETTTSVERDDTADKFFAWEEV